MYIFFKRLTTQWSCGGNGDKLATSSLEEEGVTLASKAAS